MNKNKVSIIITAYSYDVTRAVNSCLKQTYRNTEIIIVDDASIKDIGLSKYRDNPNIQIVRHSVNKGAGESRRTGLKYITGDFTLFLDSDDYLEPDCIETMCKHISDDIDIICPGTIYDDRVVLPTATKIQKGAEKFYPENDTKRFLNCMLVRASLWDKVDYCKRRYIEDTPTLFKLLHYAKSIKCIRYAGYHYTTNNQSLTHTANECKNSIFRGLCMYDIYEFTKDKPQYADTKEIIKAHIRRVLTVFPKNELDKYNNEVEELKRILTVI